ncbi:ABC transporter substrate-binding protein [Oceaniglobus indicus]|uniref:ABC transporter substrate-binding protein n=1 Tax=Oceaniglobus indicus TaxID=2047749 RepID=UPI000C1768F6|nr:extracellular solute-binding protein [Oceaniglobus indicus]
MTRLFTTAAALALIAPTLHAAEIRVLNWQGYGTDIEWAVKAFEEATGNTVVHEYFNSEQETLTKLRTNPGAYDVVLINSSFTPQVVAEDLLAPIDPSKLENFDDLDPAFVKNNGLNEDGALYGVPWAWGLTAIAVSNNDFDTPPTSLEVLWNPDWAGRVSIRDDAVEAVQIGALATGQDINDVQDLEAVRTKLAELMPAISTYWGSENDWNQYMASGEFAAATYWSGSASRSIGKGLDITFVVPDEGAIGWLDGLSIPKSSENKDAAYAFIDWMIDPEFYSGWDKEGAPATANTAAAKALPDDSFNKAVLGDPEVVARVQFMQPMTDDKREEYLKLWQDLKAVQ